jgi:hypothetical protein
MVVETGAGVKEFGITEPPCCGLAAAGRVVCDWSKKGQGSLHENVRGVEVKLHEFVTSH